MEARGGAGGGGGGGGGPGGGGEARVAGVSGAVAQANALRWLPSRAEPGCLNDVFPPLLSSAPTLPFVLLTSSGAVPSVGGSCFVAGAGRRRQFVALRPRARV